MGDVLADETGDEVVAVVMARLHAQAHRITRRVGRALQQPWFQLAIEKFVGLTLINQDR